MDILDEFSTRLKEQMEENNLTVMKLYELSGCPVSNISKWLNRKNCPLLPSLVKLADVFNCSVDYLVGRSDNPAFVPGASNASLGERIKTLCKDKTPYRLAKNIKINNYLIYLWINGKNLPNTYNLIRIADDLGVSLDYLAGRTDIK